MNNRARENFIIHIMNAGFQRAAESFSKLVGKHVRITNSPSMLIHHDNDFSCFSEESGDLFLLTTAIIGEVSGKSFLIISEEESEEIFKSLGGHNTSAFREAFLLEIDNIISASVVSELSNALSIEVYGDVPHVHKIHASDLYDFMQKEITLDGNASMVVSNATFQFEGGEQIHPQFLWRLSSRIFEIIPEEKLVA